MHKWWLVGAGFTMVVVGVLTFVLSGGHDRLESGDKLASIVSLFVSAAGLILTVLSLKAAKHPVGDAVDELARLVDTQWRQEASTRGLLHPEPIRTRWSTTVLPVAAPVSDLIPLSGGVRVTRVHGDVTTVATVWDSLPSRQLVLIGAPGAGKTSLAVVFVRQLLAARAVGDPVPVLLTLSDWDPTREHLDAWLSRRLMTDYPQLTVRHYGKDAAARLVERRAIIPVLDGLDEMTEAARSVAITALTDTLGGDRPLILTCRTDEYKATIARSGIPLGRATVVKLSPVTGPEAAEYLIAGRVDQRWSAVKAELSTNPDGILATAFSTPLIVYLARTAYAGTDANPTELLRFKTVEEVENCLLDAYLPAVYRFRPPAPGRMPYRRISPDNAVSWLQYIARRLQLNQTQTLKPWSMILIPKGFVDTLLRPWRGPMLICVAFLCGYILGGRLFGPFAGLTYVAILLWMQSIRPSAWNISTSPLRVRIRLRWFVESIGIGIVFYAYIATSKTYEISWRSFVMIWNEAALPAVASSIPVAVFLLFAHREHFTVLLTPSAALRYDRTVVILTLVILMLAAGGVSISNPSFSEDILFGPPAIAWGSVIALVSLLFSASFWCRWQIIRLRCWLARVLPWRQLSFLEDAHRRGVLRRVGMDYQFRHARLQDHLAIAAERGVHRT